MFDPRPELPVGPDEGAAGDECAALIDDAARLSMTCARPVDSWSLSDLDRIDLNSLTADEAVTYLQQVQRFMSYAAGLEAWRGTR